MRYDMKCVLCGKDYFCYYEGSRYCSRECYDKDHRLNTIQCPTCRTIFQPSYSKQIYCNQECYSKSEKLKEDGRVSKLIKSNSENKWHEGYIKDEVSYGALHDWVRYHKDKTGRCEICQATETGYEKDFDLANISGEYKRDLEDYAWLCRKCHSLFDRTKRKPQWTIKLVESKMTGKLDKLEKEKVKWIVETLHIPVIVAFKGKKKGVEYE